MKRILLASVAALASLVASQASAADLGRRVETVTKAPVYVAAMYNWTGFYVGINGGYGWGDSSWSSPGLTTGDFDISGGLVGGTVGYNWQVGQAVFGIEGDIDWSDIRGSTTAACPLGCETRNSWLATVRGRLGYAYDRFLPYVTGGLAVGEIDARPVGLAGTSDTNVGWTVGAGFEFALAGNWTAKAEYLYVDLGSVSCSVAACGGTAPGVDIDFQSHVVRAGLNYRF